MPHVDCCSCVMLTMHVIFDIDHAGISEPALAHLSPIHGDTQTSTDNEKMWKRKWGHTGATRAHTNTVQVQWLQTQTIIKEEVSELY
jgi:hypothetical protein